MTSLISLLLRHYPLYYDVTRYVARTNAGGTYSIVDGIVVNQGPNYALAKRIQHWRAMLERYGG